MGCMTRTFHCKLKFWEWFTVSLINNGLFLTDQSDCSCQNNYCRASQHLLPGKYWLASPEWSGLYLDISVEPETLLLLQRFAAPNNSQKVVLADCHSTVSVWSDVEIDWIDVVCWHLLCEALPQIQTSPHCYSADAFCESWLAENRTVSLLNFIWAASCGISQQAF